MTSDGSISQNDIKILKTQLNNVPFKFSFYSLEDVLESQARMSISEAVNIIRSYNIMNKEGTKMMWKTILYGSGTPAVSRLEAVTNLSSAVGFWWSVFFN